MDIQRASLSVNGESAPVWKVTLNHDVNHTTQGGDSLAGVVSADRRNWLAEPHRQVIAADAAVKTQHLLAQAIVYDTLLVGAGYRQQRHFLGRLSQLSPLKKPYLGAHQAAFEILEIV